jgi:hypothetical protein
VPAVLHKAQPITLQAGLTPQLGLGLFVEVYSHWGWHCGQKRDKAGQATG